MARRYDHSPEELRNLAIRCGIEEIVEKGYHAFSARGVAGRMGYSVGTLYNVFGNLDTFLLTLNAATLDEWYEELSQLLASGKGDALKILTRGYIGFARTHYNRFLALFEHQAETIPDWYQPKMQRLFALVEDAIRKQVSSPKKASHTAKVLWASIHGITVLSLSGKLEVVGADAAEKLMDTVLAGLFSGNGA